MPKEVWGVKVLYFGEDPRYLQEFVKYCKVNKPDLHFQSCYHYWDENETISASVFSIYKFLPHVILLDFSGKSTKPLLRLSTFLSKHYPLRKIPVVAFIKDHKDNEKIVDQILLSGIHFIQRKSPEFYNLCYYLKCLKSQSTGERIDGPMYFKVPYEQDTNVESSIRIGHLKNDLLHIETDFPFSPHHRVVLNANFENIESRVFLKPVRRIRENLTYTFNQSYDMEFVWDIEKASFENNNFINSVSPMIDEAGLLYEKTMLPHAKKRYQKFIQTKQPLIFEEKKTKILVLDRELEILKQKKKHIEEYPFDFVIHAHLDSKSFVIPEAKADIITISYDEAPNVENKNNIGLYGSNNLQAIKEVIKRVESMKGYTPFIIVYNYSADPYVLKDLEYPRLIVKDTNFNLNKLLDLCSVYERKDKSKTSSQKDIPIESKKIFLNRNFKDSIAYLKWKIRVQFISETHIKFTSTLPIPNLCVLKLNLPPELHITVVDKKNISDYSLAKDNEYIGIIHGPGETIKNQLRKLLNENFKIKTEVHPVLSL
jgi:hypothetical protein